MSLTTTTTSAKFRTIKHKGSDLLVLEADKRDMYLTWSKRMVAYFMLDDEVYDVFSGARRRWVQRDANIKGDDDDSSDSDEEMEGKHEPGGSVPAPPSRTVKRL